MAERQLTSAPCGHILTNVNVWSPDSARIVYDVRSDPAGTCFDGTRIETVDARTGEVRTLYASRRGACCGVATYSPVENRVTFILGPEDPTADWTYGPARRQGVMVEECRPGVAVNLDARELTAPFTPGALRGGTHVHIFSGDGRWVSFTYNDHVLGAFAEETDAHDVDLRNVGVSAPFGPVRVSRRHPRNHDGMMFSVVATRTTTRRRPGSDDIARAFEDAWVGERGYRRADGGWQARALAFQGEVLGEDGDALCEVFIVDLPEEITRAGDAPLEGTESRRPAPPLGTVQRRLTYTAKRKFPGIAGPRHWLRSSPDGRRIAFLMKDDAGVAQLWMVSPNGGEPAQLTRNPWDIGSAFTWSRDGRWIAHVMDNSVFVTDAENGAGRRLTPRVEDWEAPRPEACVVSPDGRQIAYVRPVRRADGVFNQVFAVEVGSGVEERGAW